MGSSVTNIADIQQDFMNNITQKNQQNCVATTASSTSGNVVIVDGARIGNNFIGVSSQTSTDASCMIVSSMEDNIESILSSIINQTALSETDLFGDFAFNNVDNSFDLQQSITNNINQINETTCSSNTLSSTNNNYVYVHNSSVGGNFVGVSSNSVSSANCTLSNVMKNVTYNEAKSDANQEGTAKGIFVSMVGAFAAIIGMIVFIIIILFAVGAIGMVGYEGVSAVASSGNNVSE